MQTTLLPSFKISNAGVRILHLPIQIRLVTATKPVLAFHRRSAVTWTMDSSDTLPLTGNHLARRLHQTHPQPQKQSVFHPSTLFLHSRRSHGVSFLHLHFHHVSVVTSEAAI